MSVRAGAEVCVTDNNRNTCLILAAHHTETVRTLLCLPEVDCVNQSNTSGFTPLHGAVSQKHPDVSKLLIDAGADIEAVNYIGRTPLHCACEVGALEIVEMLVKAGADESVVDNKSHTSLNIAAYRGHTETVRYLVGLLGGLLVSILAVRKISK